MAYANMGNWDILPDDQNFWQEIENTFESVVDAFGFEKIHTSFFDDKSFYADHLDLEKDWPSHGDLILRPNHTLSILRAFFEHQLDERPQPFKFYFLGPVFRPDEQNQFGAEIVGSNSPLSDAFLIGMADAIYKKLGIENHIFVINSLGCADCQNKINRCLTSYFSEYKHMLCPNCLKYYKNRPLKLLACKNENCRNLHSSAPVLVDILCEDCKENLKEVLEYLDDIGVAYDFNPRFSVSPTYFTKTIFEIRPNGKTTSLGSGGRYDHLIRNISGKEIGGIGFMGKIPEIIKILKNKVTRKNQSVAKHHDIFLIFLGSSARKKSLPIVFKLHKAGFKILATLDQEPIKMQLDKAKQLNVPFAIILGQKEARDNTFIVKSTLDGSQETVDGKKLVDFLKKRLGGIVKIKKHFKEANFL